MTESPAPDRPEQDKPEISLQPPVETPRARFPSPGKAVKVVHEAQPKPSTFLLAVGMVLVALSAIAATMTGDRIRGLCPAQMRASLAVEITGVSEMERLEDVVQKGRNRRLLKESRARELLKRADESEFQSALRFLREVKEQRHLNEKTADKLLEIENIGIWQLKTPWAYWLAGGVLLVLGGLCLRSNLFNFVLTTALFSGTALCIPQLMSVWIDESWLALLSVSLAYLSVAMGFQPVSLRGVIGWLLVAVAGYGTFLGWFDAAHLGEKVASTMAKWQSELPWACVLVLTGLGVTFSKSKPVHFLSALMLAALAYHCVDQGFYKVHEFESLAREGGTVPTVVDYDVENVSTWRWVLAGELCLLGVLLLHAAMGIGSLVFAFAAVWVLGVLGVDKDKGLDAMAGYMHVTAAASESPVKSTTRSSESGLQSFLPGGGDDSPPMSATQKADLLKKANYRLVGIYVWIYATALLAGMIGISGLRMLVESAKLRTWILLGLWFTFGFGVALLSQAWPETQTWLNWLSAWVIPKTHVYAIMLVSLGVMAILGSWALRPESKYETWLYVAVTAVFIGTALSLVTVALLIKFGGMAAMPGWFYAAVAAGQSSLMWALLMHRNIRSRPNHGVPV